MKQTGFIGLRLSLMFEIRKKKKEEHFTFQNRIRRKRLFLSEEIKISHCILAPSFFQTLSVLTLGRNTTSFQNQSPLYCCQ